MTTSRQLLVGSVQYILERFGPDRPAVTISGILYGKRGYRIRLKIQRALVALKLWFRDGFCNGVHPGFKRSFASASTVS
jgi:hypothetical protein